MVKLFGDVALNDCNGEINITANFSRFVRPTVVSL